MEGKFFGEIDKEHRKITVIFSETYENGLDDNGIPINAGEDRKSAIWSFGLMIDHLFEKE